MYLLAFLRDEADGSAYMVGLQFKMLFYQMIVRPYFIECKRLVELYHEVVLEISRNTATVAGRVADNLIFFGDHLHIRAPVKSIDYHIGIFCFGEGETEIRTTLCRGYFRGHVIFGQVNAVVIGSRFLRFM